MSDDRELLTKDLYLAKLARRSRVTARGHKTAINSFEEYLGPITVTQIKKKPLKILGGFVEYLEQQGKKPRSINSYLNRLKRYFRLCFGIKLDSDDFKDFVALPQIIEDELEPLLKEELKLILQSISNPRRKALVWFISSTGCRIAEALQVRIKDIDFTVNPPLVTLPAKITKGKKRTRYQYLTRENTPLIQAICSDLNEDDRVFTSAKSLDDANTLEHIALNRILDKIKLNEKYEHNGRYKKSFHSMRAYSSSQIYNHTRDSEYAHAYIGHGTYLVQYLRKSDTERAKMFLEVEPALMIFEEYIGKNDQQIKKQYEKELVEIKEQLENYKVLDDILSNLSQPIWVL